MATGCGSWINTSLPKMDIYIYNGYIMDIYKYIMDI